jgi:signal transduction histidine kinase
MIFRSAEKSLRQSRELSESKRITEELMQSRHQLLLSISHDVKAPLCSILSYLEFWEKDDLSAEEIRQLSSMQNSATHILNMLTNLLEFSRLEQKKTQIQNQTIEPIPLFLEIIDLFKPMADGKNLKFSYQFKNLDNCQITIDSLKLRQIVTNLISNAIKYTTQGEIQLFAELLSDSAHLKIVVSDTGVGIPKEKLGTIFDPFLQFENRSANIEGSGFGLFVVKGLTDVLNGTISVESSEKGTTFDVELPL